MPLHVSSTCAHHKEVKIALHSLWYHQTSCTRRPPTGLMIPEAMQFWPPDDEHMCSKHVEAWNKLILKQKLCASSWLITEINILRCTVRKTSKSPFHVLIVLEIWEPQLPGTIRACSRHDCCTSWCAYNASLAGSTCDTKFKEKRYVNINLFNYFFL